MADLSTRDEERLRSVEKVAERAMGAVNFAKWFVGIALGAILSVGGLAIGNLLATVGALQEAKLQASTQHANDISRLEKAIEKLSDRIEKKVGVASASLGEGIVIKIENSKLIARGDENEWSCTLTAKTRILINGRDATANEIRPEMHVRAFMEKNNVAAFVEATGKEEPRKPAPSSGGFNFRGGFGEPKKP
jgi:hypothetical protein